MTTRDPLSREVRRLVAGNTLSALGTGFTLPFLLVYFTGVRGFSVTTAGAVLAMKGVVGLASVPLMGTLSDRLGPWRVLVATMLCQGLGTGLLAAVTEPWHAFVAVSLISIGAGGGWPAQSALIAALVPPERRPRVYAVQFALLNLGIGIGGAVSGLLVDVARPATFEVIYIVDAFSFVAYAVILVTIRHVATPKRDRSDDQGGYREVFRDKVFLRVCGVVLLLSIAGYGQIDAGFPGFVSGVAGASTRVIGFAFAANTAVIVVAQLYVERHLQGRRRTRALAGVAVLWALSWLVIGSAALTGGAWSAAAVISGLALFGLGETLWAPTGNTLVNEIAPPHLRGRYNAVSSLSWQLSSVIGPVVAGVLLGADLPVVFIASMAGLLTVVAVLALRLGRHLSRDQDGMRPLDPSPRRSSPSCSPRHACRRYGRRTA
jgi:MFS family permease